MTRYTGWRHTIAAPVADLPGIAELPSVALPGSGGYRLPLRRARSPRRCRSCKPHLL
jgi:hypothetical protein